VTELLDNPIWNALATEQADLAERAGDAARFPPSITALGGLRVATAHAFAALAGLLAPGDVCGVLLDEPLPLPAGLARVDDPPVLQMVHDGPPAAERPGDGAEQASRSDSIVPLGAADAAAMQALAEATRPGPFGPRTHELGFLGVRDGGRLIAMAGQRMRLPGLVEVSGICTDPAHLGRGHAARLTAAQLARIHAEGARAFLHVKADNARAIGLYERLGFRARRRFAYLVVRRPT
jgi:ribosomal protein S18 acetylase RimI-like enzyme